MVKTKLLMVREIVIETEVVDGLISWPLLGSKYVDFYQDGSWHIGPDYPINVTLSSTIQLSSTEMIGCGGKNAGLPWKPKTSECFSINLAKKPLQWTYHSSMVLPIEWASLYARN